MKKNYWRLNTIAGLNEQVNQTYDYLMQRPVRMRFGMGTGPVPLGQGEEVVTPTGVWFDETFGPLVATYNIRYAAWLNPGTRTHIIVAALNEAKVAVVDGYTQLYTGVIKGNPLCTDEDLAAMGLPLHEDKAYTPAPKPDSIPEVMIELPGAAVVRVVFKHLDTPHGGKPRSIHGAEILYAILDHEPESWGELIHSDFATSSPHDLVFDQHDRGNRLYISLRWENTRGEKGLWSTIQEVVIP